MMLNGGALDGDRILSRPAVHLMTQVHTARACAYFLDKVDATSRAELERGALPIP